MKKLLLLLLMAIAIQTQAQNVGIGTATPAPTYKLHVHTSLPFTDASIGITNSITTDANNRGARFRMNGSDLFISNNEATGKLSLTTNLNQRLTILSNGKVGIGVLNPVSDALLEVDGNTKINGELNRPSTGTANMVPIAYGTIFTNGNLYANSGNISCVRTAAGSYEITITGEDYFYLDYITNVTQIIAEPKIITTNSVSGKLLVFCYNLAGNLTDSAFSFVTYKP